MTHLKRLLWLAAWCVWLWLGFGLYRELPRELGSVAFRLPRDSKEDMLGFLYDRPSIFSIDDGDDDRLPTIRLRNERSGEIEFEVKSEGVGIPREFDFFNSFRHGFHGRCEGHPSKPDSKWPVFVLDLSTGRWRRVDDVGRDPKFHPSRPWVMFSRDYSKEHSATVVVLDLKTGRRVFDTRLHSRQDSRFVRSWRPFFIGDDRIGIPVKPVNSKTVGERSALEIWSLATGQMIRRLEEVEVGEWATSSRDGKIAWYDIRTPYSTDVRDGNDGKRLAAFAPEKFRIPGGLGSVAVAPAFSSAGDRILSTPSGALFEIVTGNLIWDAADHEFVWIVRPPDRFEVRENWKFSLFGKPIEFDTFAIRRLDDGSFLTRSAYSTLAEYRSNSDETLFLEHEKSVRELPLRVNWLYMTAAQAILAAPIILLWASLRWRRKKRARSVSDGSSSVVTP